MADINNLKEYFPRPPISEVAVPDEIKDISVGNSARAER